MTQQAHTILALIILMIFYQIIFHKYLKHLPANKKNRREWNKILGRFL